MKLTHHDRKPAPTPARLFTTIFACAVAGVTIALAACIGDRPATCDRQSDCVGPSICTSEGFCETECTTNADCPCGSTCTVSCGVCIRTDRQGPATCFAFHRGLATVEVLGACGVDPADAGLDDETTVPSSPNNASSSVDAGDGGQCDLPPVSAPLCKDSPPLNDAAAEADATADVDAAAAGNESAPQDASADSSDSGDAEGDQ